MEDVTQTQPTEIPIQGDIGTKDVPVPSKYTDIMPVGTSGTSLPLTLYVYTLSAFPTSCHAALVSNGARFN